MQYLIIHNHEVFYTNWYSHENNFVLGMIVVDLYKNRFTNDGKTWQPVEEDSL
jgi:hypothetical protein